MKRILCIILISLNIMVLGCNQKPINDEIGNNISDSSTSQQTQSNNAVTNKEKEIELDKPFNVETEHGLYSFTIKSVTKTDWWQRNKKNTEKTVVLLNLECDNIDFTNKDNTGYDGVNLYNAFTVKDENNYMLDHFSVSYSEANMGSTPIPPNTKGKISMPFVAENDIHSVTLQFNRGGIIENIPVGE